MYVMNVSQGEYDWIMRFSAWCYRSGKFDEAAWIAELGAKFGCRPHHRYELKVREFTPDQLTLNRFEESP